MERNSFSKIWCLVIAMLLISNFLTAQTNEFSVKQAVDYGIKNSVKVLNALLDIKIQEQTNREITAQALPQISASGSITDYLKIPVSLIPGEIFGGQAGSFIPVQFGTKYNASGGIDASQILFDGQVFVGLQARSAAIDLATKTADVTAEQIKANIYKIYYQLVVGKKQLSSVEANIERFEKLLYDTKEIFKNGFVEKLDVDKVSVQMNNLKTEKQKIENQLLAGHAGLKFLMNMPQKEMLVLTDTLSEEELKSNILDEAYSYTDRKEFQLLNIASKLNKYNIKRYQLSRIPTFSVFGSYTKNAQRTEFDFFKSGGEWFTTSLVGLRVAIPIFDGFARRARIENARLVLAKTNNNIQEIKESIDNDVTQSRIKMKSALLTIDDQKQNVKLAESVFNTTKKKYDQGLGSNQEIYNAQTELKVAQNNYYSALYDAITAKIDYLKAIGQL
ncbi:MAG: TolC family protein [Chitinophagaceae bacterium]|nr:TolC family protein [Chitinophagaceae bacterium]